MVCKEKKTLSVVKTTIFSLVLVCFVMIGLTACVTVTKVPNSAFPNIDDAEIPDILEKKWVH